MKDEQIILEGIKILQSGQLKQSIEGLNSTVANLKYNLDGANQAIAQLNKGLSDSNVSLKEIAELNRSASKQTNAIYILTAVMVLFMIVQILIMKGII